jgi:hypothetical protein
MQSAALRIWAQARLAEHTPAEPYLRSRGIRLSIPPALRFHPRLKHPTGIYVPGIVAAVRNANGTLVAIHRTFLKPDGSGKADLDPQKAALGPVSGGVVALAPLAEVLALGEGIETMLSVMQATEIACWATLGAANLPNIKLPAQVRRAIIVADADPAGERAALEAARHLMSEGRQVRIARTGKAGADFNDLRL